MMLCKYWKVSLALALHLVVLSPSKRKRFGEEHSEAVTIAGKTLPSKAETEEFSRVHHEKFPGRKAHDIYSKVCNLERACNFYCEPFMLCH